MAQVKIVWLMHVVDNYNGETTDSGYLWPTDGTSENAETSRGLSGKGGESSAGSKAVIADSLADLGARLIPGSTHAKAAFDTKSHANADAAKTAMGVANVDVSDASSSTWALSGDGTELSLTANFDSNADADSFQTKIADRDPWATAGLVWQDLSKGVWNRDE